MPGGGCRGRGRAPAPDGELRMPLVDELAAVLRDQRVEVVDREAAAADATRRFVDLRVQAGLLEPVGTREPGETGADDRDARLRRAVRHLGEAAHRPYAGHRNSYGCRSLQQLTPRRPSFDDIGIGLLDALRQRC